PVTGVCQRGRTTAAAETMIQIPSHQLTGTARQHEQVVINLHRQLAQILPVKCIGNVGVGVNGNGETVLPLQAAKIMAFAVDDTESPQSAGLRNHGTKLILEHQQPAIMKGKPDAVAFDIRWWHYLGDKLHLHSCCMTCRYAAFTGKP